MSDGVEVIGGWSTDEVLVAVVVVVGGVCATGVSQEEFEKIVNTRRQSRGLDG